MMRRAFLEYTRLNKIEQVWGVNIYFLTERGGDGGVVCLGVISMSEKVWSFRNVLGSASASASSLMSVSLGRRRTDMDFPQPSQVPRVRKLPVPVHPLAVLGVSDVVGEDPARASAAADDELDEVMRDADVLPRGLAGVESRASGPAQKQGLQERRVRYARMACAQAREEPCRAGAVEHAACQVPNGVEVRPPEEEGAGSGPRVGVDDEDGDVDVGVERAGLLARVEDYAGHGGIRGRRGVLERLERARGAVRVAAHYELGEVDAPRERRQRGLALVAGRRDWLAALVDGTQRRDCGEHLGFPEGELLRLELRRRNGRLVGEQQVGFAKVHHLPLGAAGRLDRRPGRAAVAVLHGGDDVPPAG